MPIDMDLNVSDRRQVANRYRHLQPGDSVARIARDYGRTKARIYQILKDEGVSIRKSVERALLLHDAKSRAGALEFGNRLRTLRLSMGLTQAEFSRVCRMSVTAISDLESKSVEPRYHTVRKILHGTQAEAEHFFPKDEIPDFGPGDHEMVMDLAAYPAREVLGRETEIDPETREILIFDRLACGHRARVYHSGRSPAKRACRECPPVVALECCGVACPTPYCPKCGEKMEGGD